MEICIIGHFGQENVLLDGQTIKTRNLYECIREITKDIHIVDSYRWNKKPFGFFIEVIKAVRKYEIIIMLPAHKGVHVFSFLLRFFKRKKTKLFYSVIGGWLPRLVEKAPLLRLRLKKFDGIWVETESMLKNLENKGFKNIRVIPNFKNITPISEDEIHDYNAYPYKFCTFSRVCEEKGITDIIKAFNIINKNNVIAKLDIYGVIADNYRLKFEKLIKENMNFIEYKGMVLSDKGVETIKNYYMLIFPTKFYTEGIPGTIIDAFYAGVPILSSKWESCSDILDDTNSIVYEFNNFSALIEKLEFCINNPKKINLMKKNCLRSGNKYSKEIIVEKFKEAVVY